MNLDQKKKRPHFDSIRNSGCSLKEVRNALNRVKHLKRCISMAYREKSLRRRHVVSFERIIRVFLRRQSWFLCSTWVWVTVMFSRYCKILRIGTTSSSKRRRRFRLYTFKQGLILRANIWPKQRAVGSISSAPTRKAQHRRTRRFRDEFGR